MSIPGTVALVDYGAGNLRSVENALRAVGASVVAGAFVICRHSSNIQRLRLGTENVFKF